MTKLKNQLIILLSLLSFTLAAQEKPFSVTGKILIPGVNKLYFSKGSFSGKKEGKATEVPVINGKFSVSGKLTEPIPVKVSLNETATAGTFAEFILDAGVVKIIIPKNMAEVKVEGSKVFTDILNFKAAQAPFSERIKGIDQEAQKAFSEGKGTDSLRTVFMSRINKAQSDFVSFQKEFVKKNPDKFISLLLLPEILKVTQHFLVGDTLFNALSTKIKSTPTAKRVKEYINSEKRLSIGAIAPDFTQTDTINKKLSLSSLRGKYVLLDFWASWCGPCRQENPNVVEAYEAFKNKGFTVLGVSLDRDKKSWIGAIHKDNLNWNHVSDLQQWSNQVAVLYGIQSIPGNFLIDPQGKIIGRNLRGADLTDKLRELLGTVN
jgi:peroxiredoxin